MKTAATPQLLKHPLVAGLPTRLIEELAPLAREVRFEPGHIAFREGEDCHDFHLVVAGCVALEIVATGSAPHSKASSLTAEATGFGPSTRFSSRISATMPRTASMWSRKTAYGLAAVEEADEALPGVDVGPVRCGADGSGRSLRSTAESRYAGRQRKRHAGPSLPRRLAVVRCGLCRAGSRRLLKFLFPVRPEHPVDDGAGAQARLDSRPRVDSGQSAASTRCICASARTRRDLAQRAWLSMRVQCQRVGACRTTRRARAE